MAEYRSGCKSAPEEVKYFLLLRPPLEGSGLFTLDASLKNRR